MMHSHKVRIRARTKVASLNPCCNGWCTRTNATTAQEVKQQVVLILVVMDDALAQNI